MQTEGTILRTARHEHERSFAVRALTVGLLIAAVLTGAAMTAVASTAAANTFADSDRADFQLGTPDGDVYLGTSGTGNDGEVQLKPDAALGGEAHEFDGGALPLGWTSSVWNDQVGGTASVGAGALVVDGASAGSITTDILPGHAIEFVATFAPRESFQHVGVGIDYTAPPWAIFSTRADDGRLWARTAPDTLQEQDTLIPTVDLSVPHRYRIEWTATQVRYLVDGALVNTDLVSPPGPLRPLASDFEFGGGALSVYWLRMSPYAPAGSFTSRVFDAGQTGRWGNLQASTTVPAGTGAQIQTRTGNSAQPDGTWSDWQELGAGGEILSPDRRYIQYRAQLSTTDPVMLTPTINRVAIDYVPNAAPVAGSVTLSPASPTRVQTLTATPADFTDADGDQLTYQYSWSKDGTPIAGATDKTLDLAQAGAARGNKIEVKVTAEDGNGGSSAAASASATVANAVPVIDVSSASASAQYSDAITPFTIRAHDADGDTLSFAQGTQTLPADLKLTDNHDGTATVSGRLSVPAGTYSPSFKVSDGLPGGEDTGTATITVTPESAEVGYTGPLFVATASASATSADVKLTGLVTQQDDGSPGDLTKASVDFMLYKSTNLAMTTSDQSCRAQVSLSGALECTVKALPADNWTVFVRTTPPPADQYFEASSDAVVLTVYQPITDMNASGGGWIVDPSYQNRPVAISSANRHGNLGFTVRYRKGTTTPQGQAVYVFRGADGYTYVVKSNSWLGGGLAFGPVAPATGAPFTGFSGKANVTAFTTPGQPVAGVGGGNMTYRVDAVDNGQLGTPDTYAMNVYTSSGQLYHQAGTRASPIDLGGGNIVVRSR